MRYSVFFFNDIVLDEVVGRYLGDEPDWGCWSNCVGVKNNLLFLGRCSLDVCLAQTSQC